MARIHFGPLVGLVLFTSMTEARADCLLPGPGPALPRGAVASAEDMKTAHNAIQAYVNALEGYQNCVDKEASAAPPDQADLKRALEAQGDAAVDAAHSYADEFSEQLKIFKARTTK